MCCNENQFKKIVMGIDCEQHVNVKFCSDKQEVTRFHQMGSSMGGKREMYFHIFILAKGKLH